MESTSKISKIWYQVYPQSQPRGTQNPNAPKGHGNFAGILETTVPYISSLDIDLVYFGPFFKSPLNSSDQYYEVLSHREVDERFGTVAEFKQIISACHQNGIQVMIDFPICTLSVQSEQFQASADPNHPEHKKYKDWFVWKDLQEDGSPINNWKGFTRGTAWRSHETREQTYLAWFYPTQANLNLNHQPVQDYIIGCLQYWLEEVGVDGIRLDAIARLFNHDVSIENPFNYGILPGTSEDDLPWDRYDNSTVAHLPPTFEFVGMLQKMFPEKILMPEIAAGGDDFIAGKKCLDHGAQLVYTAKFFESRNFLPQTFQHLAERISSSFGSAHVSCPGGHDNMRLVERTAPENADPVSYTQYVLATTLALPGKTLVYQGYEGAIPDSQSYLESLAETGDFPKENLDPLKRDGARTPFPYHENWNPEGWEYLPADPNQLPLSVEAQEKDPYSCLKQTRCLFSFVQTAANVLAISPLTTSKQENENVIVWMRGNDFIYVTNASLDEQTIINLNDLTSDHTKMSVAYTNGGIAIDPEKKEITLEPYAYAFFTLNQEGFLPEMSCAAINNSRS
jgi:alpha-glucosidase